MKDHKLHSLIEQYKAKKIDRDSYIEKMGDLHKRFYEYAALLKHIDIKTIEISDDTVSITTRQDGIKLLSNWQDERSAPFEILNFGNYEHHDAYFIYKLVNNGDVIFDVGAHVGWYSLSFARKFPKSKIYSFEPIKENYNYLIANMIVNGLGNVRPFDLALGNKNGSVKLYFSSENSVMASAKKLVKLEKESILTCPMKKLDDVMKNESIKRMDFLKCDVEGAELFVFEGGAKSIGKFTPIIYIEMIERWTKKFKYSPNDIISFLRKFGYSCFYPMGKTLIECQEIDSSFAKEKIYNFFFLHKQKHSKKIQDCI